MAHMLVKKQGLGEALHSPMLLTPPPAPGAFRKGRGVPQIPVWYAGCWRPRPPACRAPVAIGFPALTPQERNPLPISCGRRDPHELCFASGGGGQGLDPFSAPLCVLLLRQRTLRRCRGSVNSFDEFAVRRLRNRSRSLMTSQPDVGHLKITTKRESESVSE